MKADRLIPLILAASSLANAQGRGSGVNFYSREKEAALGAQMAEQVRSQTPIIESAATRAYLDRLGGRLTAALNDPGNHYTFTVLGKDFGGPTHEPLALPGGPIFVPAKLFLAARNEDQLAGMLAHAMAHVAARHGTRQATLAQGMQIDVLPKMFLNSPQTDSSLPAAFINRRRAFEAEADRMAVTITSRAGYDPLQFAEYISRLRNPPPEARVEAIRSAIQQLPLDEFRRIQDEIRRMMPVQEPGLP